MTAASVIAAAVTPIPAATAEQNDQNDDEKNKSHDPTPDESFATFRNIAERKVAGENESSRPPQIKVPERGNECSDDTTAKLALSDCNVAGELLAVLAR